MKFSSTDIEGLFLCELEAFSDERGFFARAFCSKEFSDKATDFKVSQINLSGNVNRGTLRGLHYQAAPLPDPKVVRCIRGAVWDVVVDLRQGSPSYLKWFGTELTADNRKAFLIPGGCAHGFLTLEDNSELLYLMGADFVPELARGQRWDDPAFAILWPGKPVVISERDATYPDYVAP
ncbi:dTDP-4-dehydrorhamnose 3,5-epimerase family protein [Kiloniella laminariae]|uniref:dTDP-4-dehydrorhamnose 3,5-epimerase n=1 Tax=Kiloniella laminariae TaxID=454162 RepID=A0ABT4LE61_9PROT|nr:dTDP-4-dehydrorhamnose 3,5-epimerase family protein [Kiloniella laminariae]MCZ4279392.1 dTDP-4-dehydrorhamnose 3,5-epimerase family protein [Kiloniella laminariae]